MHQTDVKKIRMVIDSVFENEREEENKLVRTTYKIPIGFTYNDEHLIYFVEDEAKNLSLGYLETDGELPTCTREVELIGLCNKRFARVIAEIETMIYSGRRGFTITNHQSFIEDVIFILGGSSTVGINGIIKDMAKREMDKLGGIGTKISEEEFEVEKSGCNLI